MNPPLHDRHPWSARTPAREAMVFQDVDAATFKNGMRMLAAAVSVITTGSDDGARAGFTATAVCSVSAEPPQLLVCVNAGSASHQRIREWQRFCVNVLSSAQMQIARRFASRDLEGDRFEAGDWSVLGTGSPVLKGCPVNFDCTLAHTVEAGTHSIFIGRVVAVSVIHGLEPLAFVDGQYLTIGTTRRGPEAELWDWS